MQPYVKLLLCLLVVIITNDFFFNWIVSLSESVGGLRAAVLQCALQTCVIIGKCPRDRRTYFECWYMCVCV